MAIRRNPGVAMLWTCKDYWVFGDGSGGRLINMGEPERVEWLACGRAATREEVQVSIESGLPSLVAVARLQDGALKFLDRQVEAFQKFLPEANRAQTFQ